jgi:hypothetical protein
MKSVFWFLFLAALAVATPAAAIRLPTASASAP